MLGAVLFSLPWSWLATLENVTLDLRVQARGDTNRSSTSVIVGVADSSFTLAERAPALTARDPVVAAMTDTWPWDRRVFADLVRRLRAAGARAIVFDIVFAAENPGDADFARAIAEPGAPVILASLWQDQHTGAGEGTATLVEPRPAFLAANGGAAGYANVWPDHDGRVRQLTTFRGPSDFLGGGAIADEHVSPSLAAATAAAVRRASSAADADGYIDFSGPPGTITTVPIEDVFLPDRWAGAGLRAGELFRDRIVWVGPLSEIRFKDYHATSFGRMAGVEAQAQALETLLAGGPLRSFSPGAVRALVWACAIAGLSATIFSRRIAVLIALVIGGGALWCALALVAFHFQGTVLPLVAPLGAGLFAGGAAVSVRVVAEQRERHRLRSVLDRYVSEEVARLIVDQPDDFSQSLRGRRREITVLFADLRGFTTWVETAEPEVFVAQLNEYFQAVVDCILAQGGTLQKFIGDAVLAVWGDTRTAGPAVDAARALDAALAMQAAVARLNAAWAGRPDRSAMSIGIGLHHGVAMVGNVGHPRRMEFTVLGDVVNVAARLESANRQLDTGILISDTLRDLAAGSHRCVPLGRVILKGRSEAVDLFTPLGPLASPAPAWLPEAEAARQALAAGNFSAAAAGYEKLPEVSGSLAAGFRNLAAYSRQLATHPPARWPGIRRFDEK
jgi:adenylate cyclase